MVSAGRWDIGGRSLYAEWFRAGSAPRPSVVVEVGSTMPGTQDAGWQATCSALMDDLDVFLYDRANLGRSDPALMPRPLSAFTADLRAVLQAARVPPPYLLVGGSFGEMIVTDFASRHPDEVRGVVLVDSTHPEHNQRALAVLPEERPDEPASLRAFRRELWLEQFSPLEIFEWEGLDAPASIHEAQTIWNLGDIPLLVLTAGLDSWKEDYPKEAADAYEQVWMDLQHMYLGLSTRSRHVTVEDSDHIIHFRRPDVVIEAARWILAQTT